MTVCALFLASRRFSTSMARAPFAVPFALTASFALGGCSGDGSSQSKPTTPEKPTVSSPSGVRFRDVAIAKISHENAAELFRHPLPPPGSPHGIGVRR